MKVLNLHTTQRREAALLILALAFVGVNAAALSLAREDSLRWAHFQGPLAWAALTAAAHVALSRRLPLRDPFLLPIMALLSGWGLLLVDRLAPGFLARQMVWLAFGIAGLVLVSTAPEVLRYLRSFRYTWLVGGLLLLLATLVLGVNPSGAGATLWLRVPMFGQVFFQPSELLKLLLVVFLASYFDERHRVHRLAGAAEEVGQLGYLAPLLLMWGFSMVVLIWQRDLGAAALYFLVFVCLVYLATGRALYLLAGLALLLVAGLVGYFAFDVVALRVDTWLNPWPESAGRGFQIVQSLYALAAGGLFGAGVGQGSPTFVPVVHSDFAFAAIGEEWGLAGALAVVLAFAFLAQRGLQAAFKARRAFGFYLAAGIVFMMTIQAGLIMAGAVKLVPLTGVTLPLVSYGGSSLLVTSLMFGLLIRISSQVEQPI